MSVRMGIIPLLNTVDSENYRTVWHVFLILLFGISGHAAKNTMAPTQPILERLGLYPIAYAFVASVPMLGSILLPAAWGMAYRNHEKWVLIAVPLGQLVGQICILIGLYLWSLALTLPLLRFLSDCLLGAGLIIVSASNGGSHVVQCTVLTRVLTKRITTGFVATIGAAHLVISCCQFILPGMSHATGMVGAQAVLLVFTTISLSAGCALAHASNSFLVPHRCTSGLLEEWTVSLLVAGEQQDEDNFAGCSGREHRLVSGLTQWRFVLLLSLWKSLVVGTLHTFRTVKNGLLVSYGLSDVTAGSLIGGCQAIALFILPVAGILFDFTGRHTMIILVTLACATSITLLNLSTTPTVYLPAIFGVSIGETIVPVFALALIPGNCDRSLGHAFGIMETVFSSLTVVFTLTVGCARILGGYDYAMLFLTCLSWVGAMVSIVIVRDIR